MSKDDQQKTRFAHQQRRASHWLCAQAGKHELAASDDMGLPIAITRSLAEELDE